jgi:maltose O-acetyltransferase
LGDRVVVGAGAVVTRSFPSDLVIAGVPAEILRRLDGGQTA